jgi:hypothetical protein
MSQRHDFDLLKDAKGCLKVVDANGDVIEELVACTGILSHKNVTLFFYDDHSFQVMINDICVYHHIV